MLEEEKGKEEGTRSDLATRRTDGNRCTFQLVNGQVQDYNSSAPPLEGHGTKVSDVRKLTYTR